MDDAQLLRSYAESGSESAFSTLVQRHLAMVYHASLRRTGGRRDLAQDVTQQVFLILARHAKSLSDHEFLEGWLYTSTRYVASELMRSEFRRRRREIEAQIMIEPESNERALAWNDVRPALDGAIDQLAPADRQAILLRFFQERSIAQIAARLGLSEEAAYKRVRRALDRLRAALAKRGVRSTGEALALLLTAQAASALPAGVSASIVASISGALGTSGALVALPILPLMSTSKALIAAAAAAGLLLVAGLGTAGYQLAAEYRASAALAREQANYQTRVAKLRSVEREEQQAAATQIAQADSARRAAVAARGAAARAAIAAAAKAGTRKFHGAGVSDQGLSTAQQLFAADPSARAALLAEDKSFSRSKWGPFLNSSGFSPEQINQFVDAVSEVMVERTSVTPQGDETDGELSNDQIRSILGEDGLQKYAQYVQIAIPHNLTNTIATEVAIDATPMTTDQANELAVVLAQNSSLNGVIPQLIRPYADTATVVGSIDWDAAMTQAEALFTPAQWEAAQLVLAKYQFMGAMVQASSTSPAP